MTKAWNIPAIVANLTAQAFPPRQGLSMETDKGILRISQRAGRRMYLLGKLSRDKKEIVLTRRGERILAYRYLSEWATKDAIEGLLLRAKETP